eukprot:jgi/Phyca11/544439/estExt2_Genewise1Plus.C_PHYCAscaffold_140562
MADVAASFLPPQDIHPNNAVFAARSLPRPLTWQRQEHTMHRRTILTRIGQLLAHNAQLVLSQQGATAGGGTDLSKTWVLARKLEVLMFIHSASLLEYVNMDSLARRCIHLRHLEIVSLSAGMTFGKLSMRATNCPQRFVVTHDDHEQIVLSLAEQMRLNTFPGLSRLSITCLFTNEEADGEADVLLNTLLLGCCPNIEELCLPGNSFGDYGATKVAQMLRSQVCPKLTRLDLRRNFIGEDGARSLCHALADGCAPNLTEFCLGGNTITDSSFHHILYAMESGQLKKLRFLGIEMNYLTATSMEMLGRTVGKLVCPVLSQISYSDNSVDNGSAKRLIATAVYQERVWQAKRQQRIRDGTVSEDESSCDEQLSDEEVV